MKNLIEGLQDEMNRCRDLLALYEGIKGGEFAALMLRTEIKNAEAAIASGNIVDEIIYFKKLEGYS